jgi:autotransporter-associated beta strand protein
MKLENVSAIVGAIVMAWLLTGSVQAAVYTWDGGGADNNFSTANNWSPDTAPANIINHDIAFGVLESPFRTTANNNLDGNPASFTFNAGAAAMTITADLGKELQFAGGSATPIVNNSSNVQTFGSDIRQFWFATADKRWIAASGNLSFTNVDLRADASLTANVTLTIDGAFDTSISGSINKVSWTTGGPSLIKTNTGILTLSNNSNFDTVTVRGGKLRLTGGTLSTTKQNSSLGIRLAAGTLEVAGGNISVATYGLGSFSPDTGALNVTAGAVSVAGALIVGWNSAPTFIVSGGTLTAGSIRHQDAGASILSISGTGVVTAGDVYNNTAGSGTDGLTLNVNAGGTLVANRLYMNLTVSALTSGNHTLNVNFNGGTLKAGATGNLIDSESYTYGAINVTVKAGGAVIDTNGKTVSVLQPFLHDSALGSTPDGGLTKKGAGTLTLSVANTYSGATTINEGTLSLSQPNTNNDGSDFTIASGATLDLAFTGTDTVKRLFIGGKWRSAGVYGAVGSTSPIIGISQITGIGTLTVTYGPGTFISFF